MQLFSRSVHFQGPTADVVPHAIALRDHVSKKIGQEVSLWNILFGAPFGTVAYTARVDGLSGVAAIGTALAGDKEYEALLAKGTGWVSGPPVDTLRESLSGEMGAAVPPVGSVATVTTAVIEGGKYGAAIGWGLAVAAHVTAVTGQPVAFLMDMFGTFGQVAWIGIESDLGAADAANAKLNADAAYMEMLEGTAGMFVPGSGHRSIAVRMA
jgi:hypothetical protein